jgi:hypothetical protein
MSADGIDGRRVELLVNDKTLPIYPAGVQRAVISLRTAGTGELQNR